MPAGYLNHWIIKARPPKKHQTQANPNPRHKGRDNATCYCAATCYPSSSVEASLSCLSSGNLRGKIPERHLNQVTCPPRPASFSLGAAQQGASTGRAESLTNVPGRKPFPPSGRSHFNSEISLVCLPDQQQQQQQHFQSILIFNGRDRGRFWAATVNKLYIKAAAAVVAVSRLNVIFFFLYIKTPMNGTGGLFPVASMFFASLVLPH